MSVQCNVMHVANIEVEKNDTLRSGHPKKLLHYSNIYTRKNKRTVVLEHTLLLLKKKREQNISVVNNNNELK